MDQVVGQALSTFRRIREAELRGTPEAADPALVSA
jgi:hypothetical protein